MVYAPYGRTGIYMLQDYCRRLGIGTSEQEIGELMAVVKALPQHHPLATLLRGSRDSANADALADALLNPRDRSYSVPQLFEFIERNGLRFERWYSQAPYLPQCGAIAATPHASRLAALSEREQYAAMELWRGAIASHSVILSRDDASPVLTKPRLTIRSPGLDTCRSGCPGTLCVQERLPDGRCGCAREPIPRVSRSDHDHRRAGQADARRRRRPSQHRRDCRPCRRQPSAAARQGFFEKLHWYDQVVFDSSTSR